MLKKILVTAAMLAAFGQQAYAVVDVNTANEDALRTIKGIGPAKARSILDEREAHGPFKDGADLAKRVKGMGGHTVERLQAEGLAVGASAPAVAASGAQNAAAANTKATPAGKTDTAVVVKK